MCFTLCADAGVDAQSVAAAASPMKNNLTRMCRILSMSGRRRLTSCLRRFLESAPGLRILAEKGLKIQRHIGGWKFLFEDGHRWRNLFGIGLDGVVLDQAILVGDAERVEKGGHHLAPIGEMIDDQRASGE